MTTIVTGWTGEGYSPIALRSIDALFHHWKGAAHFIVYSDTPRALPDRRSLTRRLAECRGLADFVRRHERNEAAHGKVPQPNWRGSEISAGYSFRHDAVKFATQLFIPETAAFGLPDDEVLVWLDADVLATRALPEQRLETLLADAEVAYLGRAPKHSEIGFWAVRLNERTRRFLTALADIYRSDEVFELREWHSAFVFDFVRSKAGLRERDLTPGGQGHVWLTSPLAHYAEHLKGNRKFKSR